MWTNKRQSLQEKRRMIERHRELRQQTLKELEQAQEASYQKPIAENVNRS
jgi:hypothetical protein